MQEVLKNDFLTAVVDDDGVFSFDRNNTQTGAVVVPITKLGHIILIREYRPAVGGYVIGVVKGAADFEGETPYQVATRELREEIGREARQIIVSDMEPFALAGFTKTRGTVCFAQDCQEVSEQDLDDGEIIEIYGAFSFNKCVDMIKRGIINDSESISAILAMPYYGLATYRPCRL